MRITSCGIVVLICGTAISAAQTNPPGPSNQPLTKATKPAILSGCVTVDPTAAGRLTFSDPQSGTTYRLSGADMKRYAGRQVEIVGGPSSQGLHVVGGLVPSANVAAQAGALDPVRAAIASAGPRPATGSGQVSPEFRVKSVRLLAGACPQP